MRVYGAWIRIYYVLCKKKHTALLAICSNPPQVRTKPLGAPAFWDLLIETLDFLQYCPQNNACIQDNTSANVSKRPPHHQPWDPLKTHLSKAAALTDSMVLVGTLGPVSLRLMTSQFKDIVTHTQKMKIVKCTFCGVWVQNFVWNLKGALWNFTPNFEPMHRKICILRGVRNLTTYDILELWHLKS